MKSNKKNDKKESATQQLLNLKQFVPLQIGDNGAVAIEGEDGMLYTYIMLRPDNISVLGRSEVLAKIRNLQNILSDVAELQMLCMSSAQNYEDNKRYYRHLAETTESPIVKQLTICHEIHLLQFMASFYHRRRPNERTAPCQLRSGMGLNQFFADF